MKPVPDSEPDVSKATNKNYQLTFSTDDSSWRDSTTITVNDVSYSKASGTVSENQFKWVMGGYGYYLEIDKTAFTKDVNTVVITAEGYVPLTLNIKSDGTLDYGENKPAPTVSGITSETKESYYSGDITYYKVSLTPTGESYTVQDYLNRASKFTVTVGSKTYQKKMSLSSSWDNDGFAVIDNTLALAKDTGFSTTGNTTVTVAVPGYETLTFVVDKNGKLVTGGGGSGGTTDPGTGGDVSKKDVPTYTVKGKAWLYDAVEITFDGKTETQAWLEQINATSVKVNGTNVNLASGTFDSNFASKFYIRKGENPSYVYIGTALLTQNQNKIEITVDGYNTLEITVDKDGKEVK